ncbi:TPA: phage tail protein [Citrobacter amalonaticus]
MPINDFKPFASGPGANVTSQADWENLPALLSGFMSGKASSAQINKAFRQVSFIAAALAQFVSEKTDQDVLDDGDLPGFVEKLTAGFAAQYLSRSNPFGDIASDGPDAIATALANLRLGAGAKMSAATLTVVSATSFRVNLPVLLLGSETSLILQAYRVTSNSNVTMTTISHPVAFPVAALAFWSIDITYPAAYNLTSTASPYLQSARTCYNNLTVTGVDIGGDKDLFAFVLGY